MAALIELEKLAAVDLTVSVRARESTRAALPGGGRILFSFFDRATGSLAKVAGSAARVA